MKESAPSKCGQRIETIGSVSTVPGLQYRSKVFNSRTVQHLMKGRLQHYRGARPILVVVWMEMRIIHLQAEQC